MEFAFHAKGGDTLIVALNQDLERTLVTERRPHDHYYCQICGASVYPRIITESTPKRKRPTRYTQNLEKYIPLKIEMPCFVHKEKPCNLFAERETVEHIAMKLYLHHELLAFKPIIDYPVQHHMLADMYIPGYNVAIECQSSQNVRREIKEVVKSYASAGMSVAFIWGSRAFARLQDTTSRFEHYKLRATAAEEGILSLLPEPAYEGNLKDIVNTSIEATYEPRPYVYYRDRKLWWLHIFKKIGDRIYLGTKHPFLTGNLTISLVKTDIGTVAMFQKGR